MGYGRYFYSVGRDRRPGHALEAIMDATQIDGLRKGSLPWGRQNANDACALTRVLGYGVQ